jgi:glycosyltransferase AglE
VSNSVDLPFVSIIIPVHNDIERLRKCLKALELQSYPNDYFEVIVVDNNSDESLEPTVAQFHQAKLAFEAEQGSYAARNTGISVAKGNVLAFTDSDCLPTPCWIASGVNALKAEAADLVGGKVTFTFSPEKTFAEMFDSITNLRVKHSIETSKRTITANLFVYRYVVEAIGVFPTKYRSGGDMFWTGLATSSNFKLVYSPQAEVLHPARKLQPLLKKHFRTGQGHPQVQLSENVSLGLIVARSLKGLLPLQPWRYWQFVRHEGSEQIQDKFLLMWLLAWLCNSAASLGQLKSVIAILLDRSWSVENQLKL